MSLAPFLRHIEILVENPDFNLVGDDPIEFCQDLWRQTTRVSRLYIVRRCLHDPGRKNGQTNKRDTIEWRKHNKTLEVVAVAVSQLKLHLIDNSIHYRDSLCG